MAFLAKNHNNPIANIRIPRGQTQAMRLILDYVKTGNYYYRTGWISLKKIPSLITEMHQKIGIGMTRHQRDYARKKGKATGHLIVVKPFEKAHPNFEKFFFCVLWCDGVGSENVFKEYFDARNPHQRLHFEVVKINEGGKWETVKTYRLTHLEHRRHVAKNRRGEILLNEDGLERMTVGGRHLTWMMTRDVMKASEDRAREFVGRFLSSYKKLTPDVAEQIITWNNFLQKRPGFHGVNQQRYHLRCIIWQALNVAASRNDVKSGNVQVLCNKIHDALNITPPQNPATQSAWSEETLEDWYSTVGSSP